jgi:predicted nucleic acid-binding protein
MSVPQVVLDTNVLVSGLRSQYGASFRILQLVGTGRFDIHLSVPLVLEYEDVLVREITAGRTTREVVAAVLDFHCSVARRHAIAYLWRPFLRDPGDDMVLEVAQNRETRIPTHEVNEVLRKLVERTTPPQFRGLPVKLNYASQVAVKPPVFAIFANHPKGVPEHYIRYLSNGFR